MTLQEGIFYRKGTRPPRHFGVMFLRVTGGADAGQVGSMLARLWELYKELKKGMVRDLPGVDLRPGALKVLLGFGQNTFRLAGARKTLPQALGPRNSFLAATPGGGNRLLRGGGLLYEQGLVRNPATEEVMVQFLGSTPLAVTRPMVETWKLLRGAVHPDTGTSVFEISAFFMGFQREDARSWIDFHDGLSNPIKGDQRLQVISVKDADTSTEDAWTRGGTYMTYMRLPIDLRVWISLPRRDQELLVGRDKLTGCPLHRVAAGEPQAVAGCPLAGTTQVSDRGNEQFREPPDGVDDLLLRSHVQRANHHRRDFDNPESLRIYRQGYEFAESVETGVPRVGLNFVAFHDTPSRIIEMLTRPEWLGGVNFGGDVGTLSSLIRVAAAGVFLVPPVVPGEPFPGAGIFL